MKMLSNTEAELKKSVAYKKRGAYHDILKVTFAKFFFQKLQPQLNNFFNFMEKACSVLKIFNNQV